MTNKATMKPRLSKEHINSLTEQEQIEVVSKAPVSIGYIIDPTEEVQLAAIRKNYYAFAIQSERIQFEILKQSIRNIDRIKHPTVNVLVFASFKLKEIKDEKGALDTFIAQKLSEMLMPMYWVEKTIKKIKRELKALDK